MNDSIENVILGVIANGVTGLIAYFGRKGREFIVGKEMLESMKREKTALQPILQRAADGVAEDLEWKGPAKMEEVCLFLTSPEVETFVRQIYSASLSESDRESNLELIRQEFLSSFSLYVGVPEDKLADSAKYLFDALMEGCAQALGVAIDAGILSAHEAKSTLRHRIVLGELSAIQKNLAFFTAQQKPNLQAILKFEKTFRRQVGSRHEHIIPPHFDVARKLPIDDLYVCPNFVRSPKKKEQKPEVLNVSDFLSVIFRAVLLGSPGSGKSTFTLKLCHDLAVKYSERLFGGRQLTPILVVLRDYGAEKKAHNCSILQFIELAANSKYQLKPPSGAFEYLLLIGRAMVVFDGLDELLDTSYRQEVSNDIETFCTLYPSVPVIVTSRKVGYEQAPLDKKKFETFHLAPFDEDQVAEYVKKWFATDTDLTPDQQSKKTTAFLEESRIVPDLRSNPLMLALMCNIYRGENYIPRNRPDVYEKCAVMLFERWDKSRGICVPLPFEAHIRPAMMHLAYWIYADEKLQGGVTEYNLVNKTTDYLHPTRFEDRDEAERAACEFIEFCRGRAWVFTDTGTTKGGDRLYQFTHRTFLEYFTSGYLVRTHPTPDRLIKVLLPKITNREWDVVAQLAFQLQNKNVEGASDELLSALIEQAQGTTANGAEQNLLSFAARCLEFMVPSPKVTRDITTACVERFLIQGCSRRTEPPEREGMYRNATRLVGSLLYAAAENRTTVADCLEKLIIERVNSGDEPEAILSLEIGLNLTMFLYGGLEERVLQQEVVDSWEGVSQRIFKVCYDRIEALYPKALWLSFYAHRLGKVSITDVYQWHGVEAFFLAQGLTILRVHFMPFATILSFSILNNRFLEEGASVEGTLKDLKEFGRILLTCPPPWIRVRSSVQDSCLLLGSPWLLREEYDWSQARNEPLNLDGDTCFGVFALFAPILEQTQQNEPECMEIFKMGNPFLDSVRLTLLARFDETDVNNVDTEMDQCGFTAEQKALAWQWIRRDIDLALKGNKNREDLLDEEEID